MDCAFCSSQDIKKRTILSNELAFAFPTNLPLRNGHVLICPKRCVEKIEQLTEDELHAILDLRTRLSIALGKAFGAEGFNYAWNEGEKAGQTVMHFHLHMIPRKADDGKDPRSIIYQRYERNPTTEEELRKVTTLIKENL